MPAAATKKQQQVASMIETLRKAEDAVTFADLCERADVKYPQDVNAAMLALEHVGLITRAENGPAAYTWTGERPATTQKRRRAAKADDSV